MPDDIRMMLAEGQRQKTAGQYPKANAFVRNALDLATRELGSDSEALVPLLEELAVIRERIQPEQARELVLEAVRLRVWARTPPQVN